MSEPGPITTVVSDFGGVLTTPLVQSFAAVQDETGIGFEELGIRQNDPDVTASLRQNLDIVDNAIALCEKSVHDEPQNELAREYLYAAYQQKADLLAMMVDHSATGD